MDKSMNLGAEEGRESGLHSNASSARIGAQAPVSLGALLSALWRDTSDLVTQQADLAKAEASEKVKQLGVGVGAIAASGAVILAGFIILLLSAVNALAPYLDPEHTAWLAPLIIGGVVVAVGFIMFVAGRNAMKAQYLKPSRTIETMRRNTEMVKEHAK